MRRNADNAGITKEQLQKLCVQCFHCKNIVLRTSHGWHKCPNPSLPGTPECAVDKDDILEEVKYRFDTVGRGHLLNGLTTKEFEGYFLVCMGCNHFLTPNGCKAHICHESFMMRSLKDEGEDDVDEDDADEDDTGVFA